VAVEPLTQALPRNLSLINVVDYSQPGEDSAFALAAAVGSLPPPEKLPSPLPPDPEPPLSYLTDLVDAVQSPGELTGEQQFHLLDRLEPALTSADPEERQGGLLILHKLASRPELRAGVEHRIHALEPASAPVDARPSPAAPAESRPSAPSGDRSVPDAGRGRALPMPIPPVGQKKRSKVMTALAVLGVIFLVLLVLAFCSSNGNDPYYYGLGALLLVPPGVSNARQ
jgi:hypothetical protein